MAADRRAGDPAGRSPPSVPLSASRAAKRAFPRKRLVKICTKRFRGNVGLVPASDLKPAVHARAERDLVAL